MFPKRRPGFSMTSLLVVLGLLALLLALLLPLIAQLRRSAARAQGLNNLRQIGLAAHSYHDVHKRFPPLVGKAAGTDGTFLFHMLPYLEQDHLYRQGLEDWTKVLSQSLPLLLEPEDPTAPPGNLFKDWLATTNYAGNWMIFRDGTMRMTNITDGTSNTLMATTRFQMCGGQPTAWAFNRLHYWAPMYNFYSQARFQIDPDPADCDPALAQALNSAGIHVLFCDGSARTVAATCSPQTWSLVNDPADGNVVGDDLN